MTVFLDRSNVNGADDYKQAGVTHIYLKVSEGTTFTDRTYLERRRQALAAGAKVGGYHFAGHADPRTTRRYDRARHRLDHAPTYLLAEALDTAF